MAGGDGLHLPDRRRRAITRFADRLHGPDGVEQGRQPLASEDGTWVRNRARNRGSRGRWIEPTVDFRVDPLGVEQTEVALRFVVELPVSRLLRPAADAWLQRSIRLLHVRDLQQLGALVEGRRVR